jgi:hypothetical protein
VVKANVITDITFSIIGRFVISLNTSTSLSRISVWGINTLGAISWVKASWAFRVTIKACCLLFEIILALYTLTEGWVFSGIWTQLTVWRIVYTSKTIIVTCLAIRVLLKSVEKPLLADTRCSWGVPMGAFTG